jgi:hypothetical protein
MWYSDHLLGFLTGESRFKLAVDVIQDFFISKYVSIFYLLKLNIDFRLGVLDEKASLITFDTSELLRFDFETINDSHLNILQTLEPDGKETALFRAINFGLKHFKKLHQRLGSVQLQQYLFILTDGGDNVGLEESNVTQVAMIKSATKKLQVSGHIIQIGDKNMKESRILATRIDYQFHHFNGGNAAAFLQSFRNKISAETRSVQGSITNTIQRNRTRQRDLTRGDDHTNSLIQSLPNVPNQSNTAQHVHQQHEFA